MSTKKKVERVVEMVSGPMIVSDGKGGTLEVLTWRGEPAVLVDGQTLIRRTTIVQSLARAKGEAVMVCEALGGSNE